MMNKAINTMVLATVDSFKKFNNKLAHYIAIFAMIFGSSYNVAYAADGQAVGVATTATVTSSTTNIAQSDVTFQTAESSATTFTVNTGTAFAIDLFTTEDSGSGAAASTITVTGGVLTIDLTATMLAQTAATVYTMAVASNAEVKLGGAAVINSNGTFNVELQGGTFTAQEADAQALAFNFDSDAGADGTLNALNAGVKAFAGTVGATNGLAAINIGTATDDAGASFAGVVKATTITVLSGEASGENSSALFAGAVTGNIVMTDGANAASHATVSFTNSTAATALSGTLTTTKTDADDTFVVITDSAAGAAAAQTFAGQIGTTTNKIASIAVGTANSRAGAAVFSADVFANAVVVSSDNQSAELSSITTNGDFTATTVVLDKDTNDASFIVAGTNTTVSGTIDGAGDAEGILKITGAGTTIAGEVGIGTTSLSAIDVNATTTFSAATEAAAITVDADTTFTGAVLANTTFTVDTAGTDITLSAASDLSLATVTTGTLTSNLVLTTSDLINTAGKVFVKVKNNENGAGRYAAGDGAELHVGKGFVTTDVIMISDDANGGATDFHAGSKIYLPSNFSSGETLSMTDSGAWDATSGNASTAATAITVTLQDTALVDYTATAAVGATSIVITAADRTASAVASQLSVEKNVGTALLQVMASLDANDTTGDTAAFDAFDNAMNAQGGLTATDDTNLSLQVAPQTDTIGGSSVATSAMTGTVQGIVSNRMASLRSGDAYVTGMSAGNGMSANSGFIQAFGSETEQKNTGTTAATVYGYDSETSGVAIGFDGMTEDGSTIGLSASYSTTDVDGKGTGKSKNSIDSYTVSVYADKAAGIGYIEGSLTYGVNDNTNSRIVNTAGLDRTYKGTYDSQQISLKVGGGVPNQVKDNTYITPFASGTVSQITTDSYLETSATASDALRLNIAQEDISSLVGTVGVKAHMITDYGTPTISLSVNNEFGDTSINSNNTYQGGGTAFKTSTDVEELSATLGLGYSFGSDAASLNINYEANANDDDYLSHYGTVKIIAKF